MRKRGTKDLIAREHDFGLTEDEWLKAVRESKGKSLTSTYHTSTNNKRIER